MHREDADKEYAHESHALCRSRAGAASEGKDWRKRGSMTERRHMSTARRELVAVALMLKMWQQRGERRERRRRPSRRGSLFPKEQEDSRSRKRTTPRQSCEEPSCTPGDGTFAESATMLADNLDAVMNGLLFAKRKEEKATRVLRGARASRKNNTSVLQGAKRTTRWSAHKRCTKPHATRCFV